MDDQNDLVSEDRMDRIEDMLEETDALSQFYGTAKEVVGRYSHCGFCGGNLHFTHSTDFIRNITRETARCPECAVKVRKHVHRLQ